MVYKQLMGETTDQRGRFQNNGRQSSDDLGCAWGTSTQGPARDVITPQVAGVLDPRDLVPDLHGKNTCPGDYILTWHRKGCGNSGGRVSLLVEELGWEGGIFW